MQLRCLVCRRVPPLERVAYCGLESIAAAQKSQFVTLGDPNLPSNANAEPPVTWDMNSATRYCQLMMSH